MRMLKSWGNTVVPSHGGSRTCESLSIPSQRSTSSRTRSQWFGCWCFLSLFCWSRQSPQRQKVHFLPPQQLRLLKRARKRCDRTRLATLNCRTLLADETLDDLHVSLTNNHVMICELQGIRGDGLLSKRTKNYKIFWYEEGSGSRGVGFAMHYKYAHFISIVCGVPESEGRIIMMDVLLHNYIHPVTLIYSYSPTNTRKHDKLRATFYSQLRSVTTTNSWLMGDFNACVRRSVNDLTDDYDYGVVILNTIGRWSLKDDLTPNANGSLLIDVASENSLRHVSSHFSCRDSKRWTRRHSRYRTRVPY